jgi:thiamine-monophosphate kinase
MQPLGPRAPEGGAGKVAVIGPSAGDLGERGLIRALRERFPGLSQAGDDGAVLPPLLCPVISTDTFLEGRHFHRWWAPPAVLGRRLLEAALSDLAAMGAEARWVLAALELPADLPVEWLMDFYGGLLARAEVPMAGGETVRSERLGLTLTVLGEGGDTRSLLRRSSLSPGDSLWVTGPLGRALGAPGLLERCGGLAGEDLEPTRESLSGVELAQVRAFLEPRAELAAGALLRSLGVRCAIDISDGLLSEAAHLAEESLVDVHLDLDRVPFLDAVADRPLEAAAAGEDYLLLFGAPGGVASVLPGAREVGRTGGSGGKLRVTMGGREITPAVTGYDHMEMET